MPLAFSSCFSFISWFCPSGRTLRARPEVPDGRGGSSAPSRRTRLPAENPPHPFPFTGRARSPADVAHSHLPRRAEDPPRPFPFARRARRIVRGQSRSPGRRGGRSPAILILRRSPSNLAQEVRIHGESASDFPRMYESTTVYVR